MKIKPFSSEVNCKDGLAELPFTLEKKYTPLTVTVVLAKVWLVSASFNTKVKLPVW